MNTAEISMMLPYTVNAFNDAVIDSDCLPEDRDEFSAALDRSIKKAQSESLKLIWLFISTGDSELVPAAAKAGFFYHHADTAGIQMLFKIRSDAFVPNYATHYIGVGGVLLDEANNLLVVQEKHHKKKHYKLPGGAVEPEEHLAKAAVREVFEETGIRSQFLSLNGFRHWHGYRYGKSDIYFICRLQPLDFRITPDENEIAEARWMPLEHYLNDPTTLSFNRKVVETTLNTSGLTLAEIEGYGSPETHEMLFALGNKL